VTAVWVDGRVSTDGQARVAALDHGFTVGDGVFETCKILDGQPFALTRHLARLGRSAALVGLEVPADDVLRDAVAATLAAQRLPLGRLRITVTGGPGPLGSERGPAGPTRVVALAAAAPWPDVIRVVTVPWSRNENSAVAGAKTTSYSENVVALRAARERDAHEALVPNTRGELSEGTGSNVVLVTDEGLVTPPLSSGCLAGITRELFLEWAAVDGLPVLERPVMMGELDGVAGLLLTSSTRDVQPVAALDGRPLQDTGLGRAAAELFDRYAAKSLDP
jgi:branched-chain amino acid aminotransferase